MRIFLILILGPQGRMSWDFEINSIILYCILIDSKFMVEIFMKNIKHVPVMIHRSVVPRGTMDIYPISYPVGQWGIQMGLSLLEISLFPKQALWSA